MADVKTKVGRKNVSSSIKDIQGRMFQQQEQQQSRIVKPDRKKLKAAAESELYLAPKDLEDENYRRRFFCV